MEKPSVLKMLENRVWRIYLGGALLDQLRGQEGADGYFPEDWLASVVAANNPDRPDKPEREGLSRVAAPGGETVYLKDLIESDPEAYLGAEHIAKFGVHFGVLTKFLDSAERLPIQVHPDRDAAKRLFCSDYGKTEAWYILGSRVIKGEEPYILLGFKQDTDCAKLRELFDAQDIAGMAALMHKVPVKPGDLFIIKGGTPHAIGPGCFLLEIQEPTDYTISLEKCNMLGERLPDFLCHQGIGFDKMFECFHYEGHTFEQLLEAFKPEPRLAERSEEMAQYALITEKETPCFALNALIVSGQCSRETFSRPGALAVTRGRGTVDGIAIRAGDSLFVPAGAGTYTVRADTGETLELLECLPPR
ncbi:MAG TPA: class I mannose-6-phosphate isomerase [Clostridiales bacterium]|nr:class I mannose-6-phosphate isomerase [Clostridiales bacterium]HQK73461.1 class I mannose-6-phosphate isomerase [Clostridiales bacterium]